MLKDKTILLGVTGGIAAYKSAEIIRRLQKLKAETIVIMTEAASKFITPLTLQVLSKNKVYLEMFEEFSYNPAHISLSEKADLLLIAPASANIIGKIASGIADDMLSTIVLAFGGPIFIAPAMNDMMYKNPILQKNIKKLKDLGYYFIEPIEGDLACGAWGIGKMQEPEVILKEITNYFNLKKDLSGKKILITAGPTQEPIDKIRFISNYSSGKMGYFLAENALKRGAEVILISGPANLEPPQNA
ncbi:MAG: bifunctional phosphopantothenoylcysteine decarboxylase/phosphopantothenate--cysteine ligase CoaBC, partial [Armatimonadetes bacterium]|nr:bifunctional phosphopantothenoylcysteine decarboxylase/phosphopantothenate--cysteine ligase CoaBC [Armatimonadota bacterium]